MEENKKIAGSNKDLAQLGKLLSPSWISGLMAIAVALAVVIGAVVAFHYQGSEIKLLQDIQASQPQEIVENYDSLDDGLTASQLVSSIPLFIFWAAIGLVVYALTIRIYEAFQYVHDIEEEVEYVHADRQKIIRQEIEKLVIRVVVLILWLVYLKFTTGVILPYVLALAYAASGNSGIIISAGYLLFAVCLMAVCLHLHVVMLRLAMLRARAFGSTE